MPWLLNDKKEYIFVESNEFNLLEDDIANVSMDEKLSKYKDQTVSENFIQDLNFLVDGFGKQSNPADPGFNEMIKGLNRLSEAYNNPDSSKEEKQRLLASAQSFALSYLNQNDTDVASKLPKPSTLLAEKIFTLAGVQRVANDYNLQPGTVIKGSGEYNHNLSQESIASIVPRKITAKKLAERRYKTIAKKHVNSNDVLHDMQRRIMEETTADYSKIIEAQQSGKDIPVHSGLGKKNREQGGYNLEFVCAGSSNVQMAKTYKGQTGRNEIGKMDLADDPIAKEINNNILQKYKISFEDAKQVDSSKYEMALEQEYGKPMFKDSQGNFHESEEASSKMMLGVRKLQKGTTTRFNISGTMGRIMGVFGAKGSGNVGEHSIENNKNYMLKLTDEWLRDIYEEYESKTLEGKQDTLKPVNIMFKGHSRGAVAANEAAMMVNHLIEHKYPSLRQHVHISTQLLDPVPGIGSNLEHPQVDHEKGDYKLNGKAVRGLKASAAERKNNQSTVFYSIHSNYSAGFTPQAITGVDRFIMSGMKHDSGVFDAVDGHKRGYLAENGEEYRGSGLNELPQGLYFVDENKNILACKNSQEAHKAIDAMLGKHGRFSPQWSRHKKMHDMATAWFKSHPEIITEKDTRYPIEKAMREDRKAINDVLKSFDYTKPETELATDPNEILKRAVSELFAKQLALDNMKTLKGRIVPENAKISQDYLDSLEKNNTAEMIRKSPDFEIFYSGLNKADMVNLASGDLNKLYNYYTNYKALTKLPEQEKQLVRETNLAKIAGEQVGRKSMFFDKQTGLDGEWNPPIPNRVGLSADRTALNMIVISRLMQNNHSLKDIMDPFKLERERQEMGEKVYNEYLTAKDEALQASAAKDILYGFEHGMDEIDREMAKLDNLSVHELSKPENAYILRCRDTITNFGQELQSKGHPIFESAVAQSSREKVEHLFNRQVCSNLITEKLFEAQNLVNEMINHPEKCNNTDTTLMTAGSAVATVMALGERFKSKKEASTGEFKFSEAFANDTMFVESGNAFFMQNNIFNALKTTIASKKNPDVPDPKKVANLGKAFRDGSLFEGKFKLSEQNMGFEPVQGIDQIVKGINSIKPDKYSKEERKALDVFKRTQNVINTYEEKTKQSEKIQLLKSLAEEKSQISNSKKSVEQNEKVNEAEPLMMF